MESLTLHAAVHGGGFTRCQMRTASVVGVRVDIQAWVLILWVRIVLLGERAVLSRAIFYFLLLFSSILYNLCKIKALTNQ